MKQFLTFFIMLICFTGLAQQNEKTATYDEVVSKTKKGDLVSYTTQNGETFTVGDTITLGVAFRNEAYDYIQQNAGIQGYPLPNTASGSKVVIKDIQAMSKLVYVRTTRPQGYVYALYVINFEGAITNGEIKSKIMSSDQALAELKKWKDKLDLGLITQAEFDAKKAELSKYIK